MGKLQAAHWIVVIATAAVGLVMATDVLLAQVSGSPPRGETPSSTEKYWTEERKRGAATNMPSPAVDPKAPRTRNPKPSGPVQPMTQQGSPPPTGQTR